MRIILDSIPHSQHRYATVGDWRFENELFCERCGITEIFISDNDPNCPRCHEPYRKRDVLVVLSSQLSDWRREALILIHELVEVLSCKHEGITQEQVDKFDMDYEAHRHPDNEDEPGDDVAAPYKFQHSLATGIERILAQQWGVTWKAYEEELNALPPVKPHEPGTTATEPTSNAS